MRSLILLLILVALSVWVGFALHRNNSPNARYAFIIALVLVILFLLGFFRVI